MILQQTPLKKTPLLSKLIQDYSLSKADLSGLVNRLPSQKNWKNQIQEKEFPQERRNVLHAALTSQYQHSGILSASRKEKIDLLLNDDAYTVCTGHQLNLLTGPAYFIYKIAGCIKQAQVISKETGKTVLPMFWMASEDHDWEEINHTHLWRSTLTWSKEVNGPVGRTPLNGLEHVISEFKTILGDVLSYDLSKMIQHAVDRATDLAQFTFILVDALFADHPLLILDADSKELKRQFSPIMKEELLQNPSLAEVENKSEILVNLGYHAQVTAREINLFYIEDEIRERIVTTKDGFSTPSLSHSWTRTELLDLLDSEPEKFSPNVVLRPLYQESILPNLAYIGGPGELSYWMQLKGVFDHFTVQFPQLLLRNYALFIKAKDLNKMNALGLELSDFYGSLDALLSRWGAEEGDTDLSKISESLDPIWKDLQSKVLQIDQSLEKSVKALEQKLNNDLGNLEKKMVRAVKHAQATKVNQIQKFHESIHPNGVFQERYMNFFALAGAEPNQVISTLIANMAADESSLMICSI